MDRSTRRDTRLTRTHFKTHLSIVSPIVFKTNWREVKLNPLSYVMLLELKCILNISSTTLIKRMETSRNRNSLKVNLLKNKSNEQKWLQTWRLLYVHCYCYSIITSSKSWSIAIGVLLTLNVFLQNRSLHEFTRYLKHVWKVGA